MRRTMALVLMARAPGLWPAPPRTGDQISGHVVEIRPDGRIVIEEQGPGRALTPA